MTPKPLRAEAERSAAVMPRIAREQIVPLAKLAIEYALQPIVEIHTGHVYGFEALMRGFDRLAIASPVELLDHAETAGQLVNLEKMLLGRAIAKFASLPDVVGKKLFLNLDGRTLAAGHELSVAAADALRRQRITPSAICLELSERFNNASTPGFGMIVQRLRGFGVRLAIDDFGRGYSELKMLCDHGVDYVKIDGHFIRGITDDHRKRLFVATITNLAHVLGARVIAEGVETEADYVGCREAGCDLVQGYFIARPTTEITELLADYAHVMTARAKYRRHRKTDELLVRSEMVALPAIGEDMPLEKVFELFRRSPQLSFFPVVDAAGGPRGIIHERDLKAYIYMPYGRDLLHNKAYQRSLSSFVTPCPVVDINTGAEQILDLFANARGSDGVIVTQDLKYVGVLSAAALLKIINDKQVQQAQDQNPLTELPGNLSISDYVAMTALDGDRSRHFCYFDFDHFKPFNDRYGFQHGDRVIALFAGLMRRHLSGIGAFIGHVGGDDFFAGCAGLADAALRATLATLIEEFRREAFKLYNSEDQRQGGVLGTDRDGRERRFPLLRCSVAVMELPAGVVTSDLNRIDALIAKAKSEAKASPGGIAWRPFAP
jgi:diguanylate cyclase (GGDEF)-like protein